MSELLCQYLIFSTAHMKNSLVGQPMALKFQKGEVAACHMTVVADILNDAFV